MQDKTQNDEIIGLTPRTDTEDKVKKGNMKINKIILLMCMVAVAVEVSAKGNKREGIYSEYIMEAELLKTTSKKVCKINDNTRRMPDSDSNKKILDLMSADPDINRVR